MGRLVIPGMEVTTVPLYCLRKQAARFFAIVLRLPQAA